jgi:hypothetical protein
MTDKQVHSYCNQLIKHNSSFKKDFIDPIAGLSVKIKQLKSRNNETKKHLHILENARQEAENYYQSMMRESISMQPLQLELNSNNELNQSFKKILTQTKDTPFSDQDSVNRLMTKNQQVEEEVSQFQQSQVHAISDHLIDTQSICKKFATLIQKFTGQFPLKDNLDPANEPQEVLQKNAEKIVFNLLDTFYTSAKETPTGYHFISLDDFFKEGLTQLLNIFNTKNSCPFKFAIYDPLTYLHQKLVEFYSKFNGGKKEIITALKEFQTNDETLLQKIKLLESATLHYTAVLNKLSVPEVKTYDDRSRMPQKDLDIPNLDPFNKNM